MKIKKSLIGKFLIRLAALMITVSLVPSSLCLEVHAEPESEQQTQAQAEPATPFPQIREVQAQTEEPAQTQLRLIQAEAARQRNLPPHRQNLHLHRPQKCQP